MSRSTSNNTSSRNVSSDKRSLRERMSRDLQLRGMAKRTHDGYLREVRKLACYYNSPPDQLSDRPVARHVIARRPHRPDQQDPIRTAPIPPTQVELRQKVRLLVLV